MGLANGCATQIQKIITEIRAQLPALPEPQRSLAEQRLA